MSDTHRSAEWYRISAARPRLRRDVRVIRHVYLGQPWYVLADRTGTKVHRLTPAAQEVAGRLDGRRSIEEIWTDLTDRLAEDAPTQDEIVRLLSQLHEQGEILEQSYDADEAHVRVRLGRAWAQRWNLERFQLN